MNLGAVQVVVLLSLALWYALWGVPGAILAVPLAAVFRIVVSNINHPVSTRGMLAGLVSV